MALKGETCMYSYTFIPIIAMACYLFLFFSFLASKKERIILVYMEVLIAMVIWTSGSFFMRIGLGPSINFWYQVSLAGIFFAMYSMYSFVSVFIQRKRDKNCYIWLMVVLIMIFINTTTSWFLKAPTLQLVGDRYVFLYETTYRAYILFGIVLLCTLDLIRKVHGSIKQHPELFNQILPFFMGIVAIILGHLLVLLPLFNGFPIDIVSGLINAACMYYMVYQRKLFKLTLLVSRTNCYLFSGALTFIIFSYLIIPIESFVTQHLNISGKLHTLIISSVFTLISVVVYLLFKSFIDRVFIKSEIHQNKVLKEYSNKVGKTLNIEEVVIETNKAIREVLYVNDIHIALLDVSKSSYQFIGEKQYFVYPTLSVKSPLFQYLIDKEEWSTFLEFKRSLYYRTMWKKEKDYLDSMNIDIMIPLYEDELMGVIFLSSKSHKDFRFKDIDFLSSLTAITAIALKNSQLYQRVYLEARIDELTGLYNRKYFYELLNEAYENIDAMLTLIEISIDDFRLYNQLYGNSNGDKALKVVAKILKGSIGENAIAARLQGKEFALILPNYNLHQANVLAESVRQSILTLKMNEEVEGMLTASFGIASIPLNASTIKQLVDYADQSLFQAKRSGKNCVNTYNLGTKHSSNSSDNRPKESIYLEYAPTIYALQAAIDTKDHYTFSHSNNVAYYATSLAYAYGLNEDIVEIIREAALLHDVGKIGVHESILNKPGKLTREEFEMMQAHVENSINIIKHLPSLDYVIPVVISHHERYDGHGYPRKIAGEDIPLGGRILCIADSFDAMVSKRSYKEPYDIEYAMQEMKNQANKQFDGELVDLFVELLMSGKIQIQDLEVIESTVSYPN